MRRSGRNWIKPLVDPRSRMVASVTKKVLTCVPGYAYCESPLHPDFISFALGRRVEDTPGTGLIFIRAAMSRNGVYTNIQTRRASCGACRNTGGSSRMEGFPNKDVMCMCCSVAGWETPPMRGDGIGNETSSPFSFPGLLLQRFMNPEGQP